MTNEELITEARKYAQYHGIKPYTEHIFKLLDALEAAEARIARYQDAVHGLRMKIARLADETYELEEKLAEAEEFEAGDVEYAQAVILDDEGTLHLGKSFGDDPTRGLDEGYVLVKRVCGPWLPVESEPDKPAHTEHVTLAETWPENCLEGECDDRDEDGEPQDMSACPSRPFEACVQCMVARGSGEDPKYWDDRPLAKWPCEHAPVESEGE